MMEQEQEQKHVCEICGKNFVSGMSLGGHMRGHIGRKLAKNLENYADDLGLEDEDDAGYVFRENPKTSWSVSNAKHSIAMNENEIHCKECGKEFPSLRALYGHMRCHSIKTREEDHVCKQCGKRFDSMRSLFGHMRHHPKKNLESVESRSDFEVEYSLRRKRSKTKGKITGNFLSSDLNSSLCDIDINEIEEAATILMMLSRGKRIMESSNLGLKCNIDKNMKKQKKLGNWASSSNFMFEKSEWEFHDSDSLFMIKGGKRVKLEESADGFCGVDSFKKPNMDDDFGSELSGFKIENGKPTSNEMAEEDKGHVCPICFKVFPSRRALGGHKKAHKVDVLENKSEESVSIEQELDDIPNVFHIDLPVTLEKEVNGGDLGFKPWWVGGDNKREPLALTG